MSATATKERSQQLQEATAPVSDSEQLFDSDDDAEDEEDMDSDEQSEVSHSTGLVKAFIDPYDTARFRLGRGR